MFYNDDKFFLTIYFNAFDIIELYFLNTIFNKAFKILSIKDFLVDFLMHQCILFMALKILIFCSSGLILITSQPSSFSIAFCLCISWSIFLSLSPNSLTSIANL